MWIALTEKEGKQKGEVGETRTSERSMKIQTVEDGIINTSGTFTPLCRDGYMFDIKNVTWLFFFFHFLPISLTVLVLFYLFSVF